MKHRIYESIIKIFKEYSRLLPTVASNIITQEYGTDPYLVLIFCILSLRTKDPVALQAARRLFLHGKTPDTMIVLPKQGIIDLIYPVGFYRNKADTILHISRIIHTQYHDKVPSDFHELLTIKGIGPKTAQLVRAEGFGIPAICVDTHVHRIANRLGLVNTKSSEATRIALESLIPIDQWISLNRMLVVFGQTICVPISPKCSTCPLLALCPQNGVNKHR